MTREWQYNFIQLSKNPRRNTFIASSSFVNSSLPISLNLPPIHSHGIFWGQRDLGSILCGRKSISLSPAGPRNREQYGKEKMPKNSLLHFYDIWLNPSNLALRAISNDQLTPLFSGRQGIFKMEAKQYSWYFHIQKATYNCVSAWQWLFWPAGMYVKCAQVKILHPEESGFWHLNQRGWMLHWMKVSLFFPSYPSIIKAIVFLE